MKRLILLVVASALAIYAGIMWDVLGTARSQAYFESHPDELRVAIEQCRAGWFPWPECESAEAAAIY